MTQLMGIDLGTSSVKVLIADQQGAILSRGTADYPLLTPQPAWVEQQPDDWWQACLLAVRLAVSSLRDPVDLKGIGLSGQMHGCVLLDSRDRLLSPAVIWPDQRSVSQVKDITSLVGREQLIDITGSTAATGFQAATLRWFQQNQGEIWLEIGHALLPKDYLRWRMTGEFATEASDAAGTGLLDGGTRSWSRELLTILEVDPKILPPIKPAAEVVGQLSPDAAREMGLPGGIPVVTGAADTAASLLGAGAAASGDLLLTISTGGQLITPSKTFEVDRSGELHTFCSAVEPEQQPGGWYMMGATLSAGQSLRWLRDNVLKIPSAEAYTRMITWAEQAPVGAEGLIFTPYLSGKRSPREGSSTNGAFIGLTHRHGLPELVRAVLEGVVFSLFEKYQVMVENGLQAERIILAGGGARSRMWSQIVADVFGLPVQKVVVEEQSAYGAALLAGAGLGCFDLVSGVRAWAQFEGQIKPVPGNHAHYQDLLSVFQVLSRIPMR
jgi:xylulokinase